MQTSEISALRGEMLGTHGLISMVRTNSMPGSEALAKRSRNLLTLDSGRQSPDEMLAELLVSEYQLYKETEEKLFEEFMVSAYRFSNEDDHPTFRAIAEGIRVDSLENPGDALKIVGKAAPVLKLLSESFGQSRRTRAGASLSFHISYLLQSYGLKYNTHYSKSSTISDLGKSLEFVFPGGLDNLSGVKVCAATKTTVNDGVRSLFTQFPEDARSYILTAAGSEVFGSRNSVANLIRQGVVYKEGRRRRITFVAIIDEDPPDLPPNVISYSEFINQIKGILAN